MNAGAHAIIPSVTMERSQLRVRGQPAQADARKGHQSRRRRPAKGKVRAKARTLPRTAEGAR
jgi:hypothetical protein